MHTLPCPCGAVELTVRGAPLAQFYCHCDDCRKMTSAAYAAESVHRAADVEITRGETAVWMLKRNPRHFCSACGGRLFIDVAARSLRGVNAFLLPAQDFNPQFHVNCRFAILPVRDGLTHYAGMPASFGGSEETVDW
ncbi:MAG TPA: GFA family protein [Polyangiaceae bacterium]|jgi:hypothetical protein